MRISDWSSDVCSSDLALDRLVIGGDAKADQAVRHRQHVEDVDADIVFPPLLRGFGGVIARRARSDDRDMPHVAVLRRSEERRVGKECVSTCRSRWLR